MMDYPAEAREAIGTEQDLKELIADLHAEGLRARLWWVGGVAETSTRLHRDHADWFYSKVTPSWADPGDTGDWSLDPTYSAVREWNKGIVRRFIGYGADGFKIDDVYEIDEDDDLESYHSGSSHLWPRDRSSTRSYPVRSAASICS